MQWDPVTAGLIQSSFFWGYLLTQVLGGVLATKYGGKDEGDGCVAPTLHEKEVKGIESDARAPKAQNKAAELKAELPPKPKGAGRGSGEPPP